MPADVTTEGENTLPVPVEESPTQEDVVRAELSLPYHKYNDLSEIPLRPSFAATVGQATREAGRSVMETFLW